jgi:hypothetical protein
LSLKQLPRWVKLLILPVRHVVGLASPVRELIAKRIIASASKGELDPVRLQAAALSGLPLTKMSPAA